MNTQLDPRVSPPTPQPAPPAPLPDEPYYRRGEQARRWGGILLLIGVVWLVFALGSRAPLFGVGFVERTATTGPQSYAVERVVVTGVADNVELVGWSGDEVQVEAVKHGFGWNGGAAQEALEQLEVIFTPQGETLTIEVRRPIGAIIGRGPYADLRIALPAGAAVEARVVSGEIAVEEVRGELTLGSVTGDMATEDTQGSLTISTTSGDVEVRDHNGPVVAESVSGDVELVGALESPRVQTVSGDAALEGVTGRAELSSISGNLRVAGDQLEALSLESTSGDIAVEAGLAEGSASQISNISGDVAVTLFSPESLRLDVSTTSGDLSSDLPGLSEERRSLRGTIGAGGADLTINTTSGDVTVSEE